MGKFVLALVWVFLHEYHTSIAEINFNLKSQSLECSIRVFSDDLEKALQHFTHNSKLKLESPESKTIIEKYFRKHFVLISKDNKDVRIGSFIGIQTEGDATWVFLEFENSQHLEKFQLYNVIFLELFDDQSNLVNVLYPNQKRTLLFTSKDRIQMWPF